ncbi:MAG: hypothetical protein GW748_04920 [Alphaproteobacteria bacterium]|nr:hypothetical protein [Alphaproteobacteria bacterium]NCQ67068.1 hypothetical protein [Alphaproteobacteria bacterium]NCT07665.1 hypothetical protein [Alphaproteobacteria bacterium]
MKTNNKVKWDAIQQKFFNLRPLKEKKKRMELLRWLINEDRRKRSVSSENLYTKVDFNVIQVLHDLNKSCRWALHPDKLRAQANYKSYLDSLVFSEDLHENRGTYFLLPKAVITLEEYDEAERRHKEQITVSRILAFLTLCLFLGTVFQAAISF